MLETHCNKRYIKKTRYYDIAKYISRARIYPLHRLYFIYVWIRAVYRGSLTFRLQFNVFTLLYVPDISTCFSDVAESSF